MQYDVDMQEMRAYILDKFRKEGDFDFLKEGELEAMVDALLQEDQAYLASLPEDGEYDDDAAYEALYAHMQARFPEYKMYAMRLSEDYLKYTGTLRRSCRRSAVGGIPGLPGNDPHSIRLRRWSSLRPSVPP